jgi:hypothetical protein
MNKDRLIQVILGIIVIGLIVALYMNQNQNPNGTDSVPADDDTTMEETIDEETETEATDNEAEEAAETNGDTETEAGDSETETETAATPQGSSQYAGEKCYPQLSGQKDTKFNGILLNWTTCENLGEFQFYKVVRSQTNTNPSYPNDYVVFSTPNKSASNTIDKTVARATTYHYRVCAVQPVNKISCGNSVSITY